MIQASDWRDVGACDKAANIIDFCRGIAHDTVLEIGCGDGAVLACLEHRDFGTHYVGLEVSRHNVDQTVRRGLRRLDECRLYDGLNVPYGNQEFDLVVMSHVVEHLEEPRGLIKEAARVGRAVLVEVPLEDTFRLPRDYVPSSLGHINAYSSVTIRRLLQTCGLQVVAQRTSNPSRQTYEFRLGGRGRLAYYIKQCALRTFPHVARRCATYHETLPAVPSDTPMVE